MLLLKALVSIVLLSVVTCANGQLKNPFLWEVHHKGSQPFYLFGTMHLATPELQILPKRLTEIIQTRDAVYTEVKMDVQTQMEAMQYVMRKDGKNLKAILPPKLYRASEAYIQGINPKLTLKPFEKMKIWGFSAALTTLRYQLLYPTMRPIDKVIYDYARSKKVSVHGIEQIEEQLGVMDSFTQQEQIVSLASTLEYLNGKEDYIETLKALYLEGESAKMLRFIHSTMFQMPQYKKLEEKFMQRLLLDRNLKMAKRIDRVIQAHPNKAYLFAFGVMHFLGEKSVIEYLEKYGYRIKRL